eukprot:PLAT16142.1.p1 GENE.PLAT16142.1~~PLAT16142.1.p1  ORF type:complete len:481 (+),score=255.48 PLAT16142.1:1-1443(+)
MASLSGDDSGEESKAAPPATAERKRWKDLLLPAPLLEAVRSLGWVEPTDIQSEALPYALEGRDVVGLAETGSGKTGAFALPILKALLEEATPMAALALAPTRELARQIADQFEALGTSMGVRVVCIFGGVDMVAQAIALAKKPHVVVATPGRLVDHLENTKGFSLRRLRFLVLDEADRMLSLDFEESLNKLLASLPRARQTFLYSATMTSKVAKLQRASLRDPVKVSVSSKYATVSTLVQQYLFFPARYKDCYLVYVLNEFAGRTAIVFVRTCAGAQRTTLLLRNLGFAAICLHGQMDQHKRLGALHKFKAGQRNILIATDVASRGLDVPSVDLVVNADVPLHGKDYIHRVGRTARAGRSGRAVVLVTQYDVPALLRIEELVLGPGVKMPQFPHEKDTVLLLADRVADARRIAERQLKESGADTRRGRKRGLDESDDADAVAVKKALKRRKLGGMIASKKAARKKGSGGGSAGRSGRRRR